MNQEESDLLARALRERPQTVEDLATVWDLPADRVTDLVERLRAEGHLSISDGAVSYHRPEGAISDGARRRLIDAEEGLRRVLEDVERSLAALPDLMHAWDDGVSDEYRPYIDMISGTGAAADIWRLQSDRIVPRNADICMPHVVPLFEHRDAYTHAHWMADAAEPTAVRFLISAVDAVKTEGRGRILDEIGSGVDFRVHPTLPSYFWVTDDIVGLPAEWGQVWPEQIIAIRSRTLAAALKMLFDTIWSEARPYSAPEGSPWDGMLHMLARGLTVEDAALAIGLTPRTGRRRVADAMAHFGATSQFTLGQAWQRAQQERGGRG